MPGRPFSRPRTDLGGITLRPFDDASSHQLAAACAAMDPWKRAGIQPPALRAAFEQSSDTIHPRVIEKDNRVAGALVVHHPWLKGPYLQVLAVLPPFQGQGIGLSVLNWMENGAFASDRNLWVLASDFNERALVFYERFGFSQVAPLPDVAIDGCTEILMRKILHRPPR